MRRVRVEWTVPQGGIGLSTFYTIDSVDITPGLGVFFNAIKTLFPTNVSWVIPNSGDTLDAATGELSGGWSGGTAANIVGTGPNAHAAGTGAYLRWNTGTVIGGRRVKGRTFLCPMIGTAYDTDGTISGVNITTFQNAGNTLAGLGMAMVWHRPSNPGAADGQMVLITSATCPDRVTSLRTRRT